MAKAARLAGSSNLVGTERPRIRVATYNIHKGVQGGAWRKRLEIHNIKDAVSTLNADVIGLQEVHGFHRMYARRWSNWPATHQAEALKPIDYQSAYRTNAITRHAEHGNALLSRWPIAHVAQQDMSDHRLEQRGLLHVVVESPWGLIHFVVVHLGLLAGTRWRQVNRLAEFVEQVIPTSDRLIVMGDFNDWHSRLHEPMAQMGFRTTPERCLTFPARWPALPLDRIYARGMEPMKAWVPQGREWARCSDHLPLVMEWSW